MARRADIDQFELRIHRCGERHRGAFWRQRARQVGAEAQVALWLDNRALPLLRTRVHYERSSGGIA